MATRQAGGTQILARRIDGPEYQIYCGHVVDGFMADPWIKTRRPSAIPLHKGDIRKGCVIRYLRESGQVKHGGPPGND